MGGEAFKGLKKFSGGDGGVESDYSVCPRPLLWFYTCFTPVYVGRDGFPRFVEFSVCGPGCCQKAHGWDGRILKVQESIVLE